MAPVARGGGALGATRAVLVGNSEIFYVVLIGPFVKFHHLIHIYVTSVLPVVKYWGARISLKWQNYSFNEDP